MSTVARSLYEVAAEWGLRPPLVGVGAVLIFAGIFGFFLYNLGPSSKLWWPDRPASMDRGRFIPPIFIGVGIVLIVVGGLTS